MTSIRGHLWVDYVLVFSRSACSIASIEFRNTGYRTVSTHVNIEYGQYKQYKEGRILSIPKYQQYVNQRNTMYIKVSTVRQLSKD